MPDSSSKSSRSDTEDDSDGSSSDLDRRHGHKKGRRQNHSSSDTDDDSSHHNKRRKHHKKKKNHKRKHHDSDDSSSSSDDRRHGKKHHHKKHKHHHHHHKKHHHKKKHKKDDKQEKNDGTKKKQPAFGAHGYLKSSDLPKYERVLHVWLQEVKGISPQQTLSKRDLSKYFDEFREDFHTGTLSHEKYYNYEAWEQEQYQKKTSSQQDATTTRMTDEQLHARSHKKSPAVQLLDREQVVAMKHQQELRAQMRYAYKMGDTETYEKIKERLESS